MRTHALHEKSVVLDRKKLDEIMEKKGLDYTLLHNKLVENYGIDMAYKSFMNLMYNRISWKLIYAWVLADSLNKSMYDLFEIVDVDVKKKEKLNEEWKRKYQK
ncbi:hypothetical protein Q7A53_05505 [Halobacillus rhizosphaerae]|uniref:hypothetical protein n=1 Tax=Halobacillus rhizosphaerae TaxID=3064889 RepID=UPI00398B7DF4